MQQWTRQLLSFASVCCCDDVSHGQSTIIQHHYHWVQVISGVHLADVVTMWVSSVLHHQDTNSGLVETIYYLSQGRCVSKHCNYCVLTCVNTFEMKFIGNLKAPIALIGLLASYALSTISDVNSFYHLFSCQGYITQ